MKETIEKPKSKFIRYAFLTILGGILIGALTGWWIRPEWVIFAPPDTAFKSEFRAKPIQMGFPKPAEYSFTGDDMLQIYSLKDNRGIDEINRMDDITSPQADQEWFEMTVRQTGAKILEGNKKDFSIYIPESDAYLRGRIVFADRGKGIYKIFIVRGSQVELTDLESVRFLYGIKFK